MRRLCMFGVAMVAALTGSDAPHAQPAPSNQRVWTGTWEEHDSWEGSNTVGRSQAQIGYVYIQGPDEFGLPRWDSRQLSWSAVWEQNRFDIVAVAQTDPGVRGSTVRRYRQDSHEICAGGGTLELGLSPGGSGGDLTPEQKAQLLSNCVTTYHSRDSSVSAPPTTTGTRELLQVLGMPNEDQLTGCAYEKSWPKGSRPAGSFSVSVSGPAPARAFYDPGFVPHPGATFSVRGQSSTPVRWKFVIEASSRLRGYATNADVDAAFFELYDLMPLRASYGTNDPDLIFDPSKFEPPWDQTRQWKRPYPDTGARKWSTLESKEPWTSVDVNLTAMDFGAHGQVQVFVSSGCDGAWAPAPMATPSNPTPGALGIAVPEDADGNFIPDSLKAYARLAPRDDTDGEPVGDGTAGDGFTAFEEYRGFVSQTDMTCNSRLRVTHQRTNPVQKDLFIRASDPLLWRAARGFGGVGMQFGDVWTQPLAVHMICPAQYLSDNSRIVNFTMHEDPEGGARNAMLTRDPQRGLRLVNEPLTDALGRAIPVSPSNPFRSPGFIDRVVVDIESIRRTAIDEARAGAPVHFVSFLRLITFHELGHAVGMRHHGQGNIGGPVAFRKTACPPGMTEGTEASEPGVRICIARGIAVRGAQNSGNNDCPMKYTWWQWYVPAGSALTADTPVNYRPSGSWSWSRPRELRAYVGQVLKYRKDRDSPGLTAFCQTKTGTGINALPGDQNHAGDLTQPSSCARQLRIKDPSPGSGTR